MTIMNRSELEIAVYSHLKDLSDNEKSKVTAYKNIDIVFGEAVCNFVKKQFSYDEEKIQKYEKTIKLMLDICNIIQNAVINFCAYEWMDATENISVLKSETLCSLMLTSTKVTGDKIIVSLLRNYQIAVIFAKIDHSPLGFRSKIMRKLCPQYITYYYKNYILVGNDTVETARLKDSFALENRLLSMNETVYAEFVYLWGKIFKHVTGKDFKDEYKAYANHIGEEP